MSWQAEVLWPGLAQGEVLRFDAPISFWGGIDPLSSNVVLARHPQYGLAIKGKILVIPQLIGSSSSSAVMLELLYKNIAPKALILGERDAILPMGVVVAQQMGWHEIPVLLMPDPPFASGANLSVAANGQISVLDV